MERDFIAELPATLEQLYATATKAGPNAEIAAYVWKIGKAFEQAIVIPMEEALEDPDIEPDIEDED